MARWVLIPRFNETFQSLHALATESRESSPIRRANSGSISDLDRDYSPDFDYDRSIARRSRSRHHYESDYSDARLSAHPPDRHGYQLHI